MPCYVFGISILGRERLHKCPNTLLTHFLWKMFDFYGRFDLVVFRGEHFVLLLQKAVLCYNINYYVYVYFLTVLKDVVMSLDTKNVRLVRNKIIPILTLPWYYSEPQSLSAMNQISLFSTSKQEMNSPT